MNPNMPNGASTGCCTNLCENDTRQTVDLSKKRSINIKDRERQKLMDDYRGSRPNQDQSYYSASPSPNGRSSTKKKVSGLRNKNKRGDDLQSRRDSHPQMRPRGLTDDQAAELKKAFEMVDVDNSGTLDHEEVRKMLLNMDTNVTDADVNNFLEMADIDGDGKISYDEFIKNVREGQ